IRLRADARGPDHAARHARPPLRARHAPAAERRPRRVGTVARRRRAHSSNDARAGAHPWGANVDASPRRTPGLARRVLRLAPALGLRCRAATPVDGPPPRARDLLLRRLPAVVAGAPRPPLEWGEGGLPLRCVRPGQSARPAARTAPSPRLPLLRPRAAPLGTE